MASMKPQNSLQSLFTSFISLILLVAGYLVLAPTQLGGAVTYVIVDGNSMEPNFHLGDLVLVRTKSSYRVGDAVTYQNAELGKYVFHRIVNMNLDRFVLQGDNNSWLDTYNPVQDEIIGKLWVHIPKLGRAIEWVRAPFHMALTVALLGGVLMSDMIIKPNQSVNKKNKDLGSFDGFPQGSLPYVVGFLVLIFLGLTIFSFSQPLTRSAENIPYQQDGNFFYSATGTPGVYDTELVRPGEPIFPKLTCFMNVGFTYNLTSSGLQNASGSHQMYARVMDEQSGWLRTIPMSQGTTFTGNSYFANSTLDLCQVQSLVALVEQETGLHPNTYTLEIVTHVEVAGKISGNSVTDVFEPSLIFKFDKAHFYLETSSALVDPLHSTKPGLAGNSTPQANVFSIFGLSLDVRLIRVISLLGLGFALFGSILIAMNMYNATQQDQDAIIRQKYGSMLVSVYESNVQSTASTIDVTSMDDLARLAERHGTMILHMTRDHSDHYLVQNNGTTYRYITGMDKNSITQRTPVESKKNEVQKSHNTNPYPMPALRHNKPMGRVVASSISVMDKPVEPARGGLKETIPMNIHREVNPATLEKNSVWNDLQEKIESSVPLKNETNISVFESRQKKKAEYTIQSGTIEFFGSEPVDTIILNRIKV
jgi:signal peptidase I